MARITVEDCLKHIPNRFELTLAATYRAWSTLRDPAAALGFARKTLTNAHHDHFRRRRNHERPAEVLPDLGHDPHPGVDDRLALLGGLRRLAPRQREVLVLRYYGGLSEAEIAEATGLSKGTVKSTASRAVAKLGDIMRAR